MVSVATTVLNLTMLKKIIGTSLRIVGVGRTPGARVVELAREVKMIAIGVEGIISIAVPTAPLKGTAGRGSAVRVQTATEPIGTDASIIGIGERAVAVALTALMKVMPEKGRNESVRKALNMKENMHVGVREDVENGLTYKALAIDPRSKTQR